MRPPDPDLEFYRLIHPTGHRFENSHRIQNRGRQESAVPSKHVAVKELVILNRLKRSVQFIYQNLKVLGLYCV